MFDLIYINISSYYEIFLQIFLEVHSYYVVNTDNYKDNGNYSSEPKFKDFDLVINTSYA